MTDRTIVTFTQDGYAKVKAALGKPSAFLDITTDAKKLRKGIHKSYSTVSSTSADKFWSGGETKTDRRRYEFVTGAQIAGNSEDLIEVLRTAHVWLGYDEVPSATEKIERSRDLELIVDTLNDAYGLDWKVLNKNTASVDGEMRYVLDGLKGPAAKKAKRVEIPTRPIEELARLADMKKVAVRVGGADAVLRPFASSSGMKRTSDTKKKPSKVSITYMAMGDSNVSYSVRSSSPSPKDRAKSPKKTRAAKGSKTAKATKTKSPVRERPASASRSARTASPRVSLDEEEEIERSPSDDLIEVIEEVDGDSGRVLRYLYADNEDEVPSDVSRSRLDVVKRRKVFEEDEEEEIESSR